MSLSDVGSDNRLTRVLYGANQDYKYGHNNGHLASSRLDGGILMSNLYYPIKTQNRFIMGCCLLHNFIRTHIAIDPYEHDVPKLSADKIDGVESGDGFIDQVESSQAWTTMRHNLAMQMFVDYV
ncbi:hypothetical protein ACS0TY_010518 [Phlomoides rotata]